MYPDFTNGGEVKFASSPRPPRLFLQNNAKITNAATMIELMLVLTNMVASNFKKVNEVKVVVIIIVQRYSNNCGLL